MDYEDELLVDNFLDQHFYSLSAYITQLRARHPHRIVLIDQHLVRYATNVNSLCAPVGDTLPVLWHDPLLDTHNTQVPYIRPVTGHDGIQSLFCSENARTCDALDVQIDSRWPAVAHISTISNGTGKNWASINECHTDHIELSHEISSADAHVRAGNTIKRPLCPNDQGHNETGMRAWSGPLPRLSPNQRLCQAVSLDRPDNSLPQMIYDGEVGQDLDRHSLSRSPIRSRQRQGHATADSGVWNDASIEAYAVQPCTVPSLSLVICSTEFLESLRSLLYALRISHSIEINFEFNNIAYISRAIDRLEEGQQVGNVRRRILLWRFAAHREQVIRNVTQRRESEPAVMLPTGTGPIESEVLDTLLMEIYSDTVELRLERSIRTWRQECKSKRKRIKNRSDEAKNWWQAVVRYGPGILVLLPSDGKARWRDRKFEALQNAQRETLFEAWDHVHGNALSIVASRLEYIVHNLSVGADGTDDADSAMTLRLELADIPQKITLQTIEQLLEAV